MRYPDSTNFDPSCVPDCLGGDDNSAAVVIEVDGSEFPMNGRGFEGDASSDSEEVRW